MNDITQLRIQGMHCAACVVTIEGALSKVDVYVSIFSEDIFNNDSFFGRADS